jgi:tight adherence protein B
MSRRIWTTAAASLAATLALGSGMALAAEGRIQSVSAEDGAVTFILSAEGLAEGQSIDPASVRTTIAGIDAPTEATPVEDEGVAPVARTVLLTLDTSGSMAEFDRMTIAKDAAKSYLSTLPDDVSAGLVTFADEAVVVVQPTTDRGAVSSAIDGLTPSGSTALNDAVVLSVNTLGTEGSRNVVLLSDGQDEGSEASARQARRALAGSGVMLDAVALGEGGQERQLAAFAKAGGGSVVTATDADALTAAFESAARSVASQLSVRAQIPEGVEAGTSELVAVASVGDEQITDTTVAVISEAGIAVPGTTDEFGPKPVADPDPGITAQTWFLPVMVALLFLGLLGVLAFLVGAMTRSAGKAGRVRRRLDEVSLAGVPAAEAVQSSETVLGESAAVRKAVSFADRVAASRDTSALARKLDEANVALRPGEWAVVHGLVVILAGLLVTLLSGFNLFWTLLAVVVAVIVPWLYLSIRTSNRRKQFYNALPDSLQMLAGSLSAGYSLPQALDNVAKEAGGTMGMEINRALLESRLGLPIEEALEAVAQRMRSQDFHWTVMAIRINRQVGGNLAEVLANVAKTVRERERLRRQVKALSAEGKLSAWILALLPVGVGLFVGWRNPGYLEPLFTTLIGWLMIAIGVVLYLAGVLWMRNLVRMEV